MYIRIQNNSIRFRVSEQEANSLIDGIKLKDSFVVPNQQRLDYSISTAENDLFNFDSSNILKLQVKLERLKSELSSRPSKKGIMLDKSLSQGIDVFLEIDIKRKR